MYDRTRSLMLNVNIVTLREAYWEVMKKGAAVEIGILYGENLDENLKKLLIRISNCSYFPQPQDWLQRRDDLERHKKYIFRAFEDMIVQHLFGKILESIYRSKKKHIMMKLRPDSLRESHVKMKIFIFKLEVDVEKFLAKINQEDLIHFLEQDISDKFFIRYVRRLLENGVKLLEGCTDSRCESTISFLSMMRSTCEYYILRSVICDQKLELTGEMRVRNNDKNLCYLFENTNDAKIIFRRLYRKFKEFGLDLSKDNICTLSPVFDNKKQFSKVNPSRRTITRVSLKYRKVKVNLANKIF